jgi:glycosyltransferase involved in cell wall biosynthesis
MKLLLVTDAWEPQTNGVVTTLKHVRLGASRLGIETTVLHPGLFKTLPIPTYPEIRVAVHPWRIKRMIAAERPDAIHVATEGPLGLATRRLLVKRGIPFSTSLHTKFPEYVAARTRLPVSVGYAFLRWFHRPATATLVTTNSHRKELESRGLEHLVVWGRGVDTDQFAPRRRRWRARPRLLYVGRVAVEKNLEAFLELECDAAKVVVGDGPARAELETRYPGIEWAGYRYGTELTDYYANADVLVFPSRTDTFGLVMLEAMACGTPVAAFPVTGPIDVVVDGVNGALDADLGCAIRRALTIDRKQCRRFALANGWDAIARRLAAQLTLIDWDRPNAARTSVLSEGREFTQTAQLNSELPPHPSPPVESPEWMRWTGT